MERCGVEWSGLAWSDLVCWSEWSVFVGMERSGMEWLGMERFGMVWSDVV
jgi:hypothetical protein